MSIHKAAFVGGKKMTKKHVDFEEKYERWGSRYVITEGKFKGYILECKVIVERVYPRN
jgi:hypothetical protein